MNILIVVGGVVIGIVIFFVVSVLSATEGYKDESGFHYGTKK